MASVLVTDEQDGRPVDTQRWVSLAGSVLDAEGVSDGGELSMAFVGEAAMAELNQRFAGEEGPTDVLAFPMDDVDPGGGMPTMLGDVVICPAVAERNAPGHAGTYEDELALLVVHGILHLMGMDHEDPLEAPLMQRRERELLDRFHTGPVRARP
ncbi:MAG: rRNA maturation RNase YbeY [Actinobacteria bacterium]|nr:rRNA maturation RNase YbeY [Actinomycetota bacterium]